MLKLRKIVFNNKNQTKNLDDTNLKSKETKPSQAQQIKEEANPINKPSQTLPTPSSLNPVQGNGHSGQSVAQPTTGTSSVNKTQTTSAVGAPAKAASSTANSVLPQISR